MTQVRQTLCGRCGARLARDNTTGRCAPCRLAERDRITRPPDVPENFWDNAALTAALCARQMGQVIRAYRQHPYHGRQPLPQEVVAGWVGLTQAQLSRIEHGPAIVHLDRLIHWAKALRIPETYLWFKLPDDSRVLPPAPPGRTVEADGRSWRLAAPDDVGSADGEDWDVRRRRLLELVGLGLAGGTSLVALEALRHDLVRATAGATASLDEWEAVVWDYGYSYTVTPPTDLLADLTVDLAVAQSQLARASDEFAECGLLRTMALLQAFLAQTVSNLGNLRAGRRWWRTARATADRARDPQVQTWVRGREIIRGLHESWPLSAVLSLADEAAALNAKPGMGTGSVLIGRAQVLAVMGRTADAMTAMNRVYVAMDDLPPRVTSDDTSMYGWPEYRLRHGESLVYTHLGDQPRAIAAHDRALALYPAHMFRERAQVELHHALGLAKSGDGPAGAAHAERVVQDLPEAQRIEVVLEGARAVARAVPEAQQRRPEVETLRQLLRASTSPARAIGPA
jgi:transcriptional regulator with XRE-family HTH domain